MATHYSVFEKKNKINIKKSLKQKNGGKQTVYVPMSVRINATWHDEFASCVDDANAFRNRQILSDLSNDAVLAKHIGNFLTKKKIICFC